MTFEFQKPHHRRLIGATAVVTALAAAGLAATGAAGAASTPALESLSYTQTGPGGGLYHPVGVSAYSGTVYVSNSGANVVSAITGSATTAFAGSLSAYGEHGDGGEATSASLYHPGGLAVNAAGDVFIADSGDNVIREVTSAGIIKRIAGTGIAGLGYAGPAASPPPSALSTTRRTWPSTPPATCTSPTPTTTASSRSPPPGRSPPSPATGPPATPATAARALSPS